MGVSGVTVRPSTVQIESSTACNARCIFCPRKSMKRRGGTMSDMLFEKILRETRSYGNLEIILFLNGEPLLFSHLFNWLQRMREESHTTTIFTNASLLDEIVAKKIVSYADVVHTIVFSLNGWNKETFHSIMGLDYETIYSNVSRFMEINNGKIKIETHIPYFSASVSFLDKWKELWGKLLGEDTICITGMLNWGGNVHDELEVRTNELLEKQYCGRLNHLTVLWNGDIALCCMDHEGQVIAGNLYESTIDEVYNGEILSKYRLYHSMGKFDELKLCSECNMLIAERRKIDNRGLD